MSHFTKVLVLFAIVAGMGVVAVGVRRSADRASVAGRLEASLGSRPVMEIQDIVEQGHELEAQRRQALERHAGKDAVVAEVIAGRLGLFKAAARFRDLNATWPQAARVMELRFPGVPYELALCQQVIRRVQAEVETEASDPADHIVARLEADLAEHLRQHGEVRLPGNGRR